MVPGKLSRARRSSRGRERPRRGRGRPAPDGGVPPSCRRQLLAQLVGGMAGRPSRSIDHCA